MSNRKNYNSIFFLTVYLGLVLVGATPQVLAQAAMTRQFDIKNEIVVEDDLDKKPDDEKIDFANLLGNYFDDVESLVRNLQKYHRNEKFDLNADKFELSRESRVFCNVNGDPNGQTSLIKRIENSWLDTEITSAISDFDDWLNLSDCILDENAKNTFSNRSKLKFYYDNAELKIDISTPKLSKQRANFLVERFNQAYAIYKLDELNNFVKTIHQNTSIKSENNQVFIVTRLPRGSIDDLLNEKDAQ